MNSLLAYVDSSDATQANFVVLLISILSIGAICVLVALVVLLSRRKGRRHREQVGTAAVFWGMIAAGSVLYTVVTQSKWQHQHYLELLSGYADLDETAPGMPWGIWGSLGAVYLLLVVWSLRKRG